MAKTNGKNTDAALPGRILACVRTIKSAAILESQFIQHRDPVEGPRVEVWCDKNVEAAREATVVLLACQPTQLPGILAEAGMADALRGKLAISICVGIPEPAIRDLIYGPALNGGASITCSHCYIVHAMPNAASIVGESATILPEREHPLPQEYENLVAWIFKSIGTVTKVAPELMNAASITAGSTPGFLGTLRLHLIDSLRYLHCTRTSTAWRHRWCCRRWYSRRRSTNDGGTSDEGHGRNGA